jgi:membrane fusion protein (multidrug efflux system)
LKLLKTGIVLFLLGAMAVMAYEVLHWFTHVYESSARVRTELTRVSSRLDGTIEQILVKEGVRVKAGDLLSVLEHDDVELDIATLQTDLSLEEARRARMSSEREAFESELQSKIETHRKQVDASVVELEAITSRLALAKRELERLKVLSGRKLASEKDLASEQDRVLILQGEASRAKVQIEIEQRELVQVRATRKQLDVIDDQIRISEITTSRIEKTIERERVALGHRRIRSPIDSVVDRVYKFEGEYVEEGETILILHDEKVLWVEANIDEKQIRHLRIGQVVLIHFEAYPFDEYLGKVQAIGSATTQQMGISTSAGSQFGRPVERVPVRISIDRPPANVAPGMLARVNVRIYDTFDLPSLFDLYRRGDGQ